MIVATAGHVDHGKTLLVKALTGVDTDRLPEEKKRGLTIDLGFAYHDLGNGEMTGFVDVPGHERFIRTMLAGVSGIDFVVFVVAADDGPMPQTAEHLAIMDLLDVRHGVVALTKTDRVSAERIEEVAGDIRRLIADTCLRDAPIIPVSAMEGVGIDALRDAIAYAAMELPPRVASGNFRLAVDRSFLLAGAGRVVTGTVFSGSAAIGEQLLLAPARAEVRVREIHAQNQSSETANVGQRCALNIVGGDLRRIDIHRGDWIVAPPACFGVSRCDARIRVLADEDRPVKNRTPVHVHIGAADVTGRIVTLEGSEIPPGGDALVQLQLETSIGMVHGDRIILRDQSALRTIGGGVVLDPLPVTRGRPRPVRLAYVRAQESASAAAALEAAFAHVDTVNLDHFAQAWNLSPAEQDNLAETVGMVVVDDGRSQTGVTPSRWQSLEQVVIAGCGEWHKQHPDRVGVNENELRLALTERIRPGIYAALIAAMLEVGTLVRDGGVVRLPEHSAVRSSSEQAMWEKVSTLLDAEGVKAPVVHDMVEQLGVPYGELNKFLMNAARQGQVVRISDKRYFMPAVVRSLVAIVESLVAADGDGQFTVKAYRDAAGIGRNAVIEILEYFDRVGYTRRLDQVRQIRKPADDAFGKWFAGGG